MAAKADRRAAIAAELERRAAAAGVSTDRQVYLLEQQLDRGSPRPFSPVMPGGIRAFDWPAVLQAAARDGRPIDLEPDSSRSGRRKKVAADFCAFGQLDRKLMIFSGRADRALRHLLEPTCRPVPVRCATAEVVGYRLAAVADVLDGAGSEGGWCGKDRTWTTGLHTFAFFTDRLGPVPMFSVPQYRRTFVLQAFVDIVRANAFAGFELRRVWPHMSVRTKAHDYGT